MSRFIQGVTVLANAATLEQVVTSDGQHVVTLEGQVIVVLSGISAQLVWNDVSIAGMRASPVQYIIYRGDGATPKFYYPIATIGGQTFIDSAPVSATSSYYVVPLYEGTVQGTPSNIVQITVVLP